MNRQKNAIRPVHPAAMICRAVALVILGAGGGCLPSRSNEVVVYAALDREFSEPILRDFESQFNVSVLAKYDIESTKTVGLTTALIQEQRRPRCDVFWNNEILHTLRLQRLGLLDAYVLPDAANIPANYRSPTGKWYGLAARARILIVNTKLVPAEEIPSSIHDLVNPKWRNKCGIAKPLFGTTATHCAVLYQRWGQEEARRFFTALKENSQVLSGNKQVAASVGQGSLAFGLTDTDDAIAELDQGQPVKIVFPDQRDGEMGALFIPNTVCILKGAPHAPRARQLLDYLLTPAVESRLAAGASAQFPLHSPVRQQPRVYQEDIRWMPVDFQAVADVWEAAAQILRDEFASGN